MTYTTTRPLTTTAFFYTKILQITIMFGTFPYSLLSNTKQSALMFSEKIFIEFYVSKDLLYGHANSHRLTDCGVSMSFACTMPRYKNLVYHQHNISCTCSTLPHNIIHYRKHHHIEDFPIAKPCFNCFAKNFGVNDL